LARQNFPPRSAGAVSPLGNSAPLVNIADHPCGRLSRTQRASQLLQGWVRRSAPCAVRRPQCAAHCRCAPPNTNTKMFALLGLPFDLAANNKGIIENSARRAPRAVRRALSALCRALSPCAAEHKYENVCTIWPCCRSGCQQQIYY
jgi:hypothetical protein